MCARKRSRNDPFKKRSEGEETTIRGVDKVGGRK
jgi:hypothetical protein